MGKDQGVMLGYGTLAFYPQDPTLVVLLAIK